MSGLCLVLAYPPFDQGWLAWWGLIPAFFAVGWSSSSPKRSFGLGYLWGLIFFGGTFWWIGHVTVLGITALVLYLALYPALWLWMVDRWTKRAPFSLGWNVALAAGGASGWVILEWARGWLLTGFTWNYLGVALHRNVAMIQLASLGGVHLLSWLVVLVNLLAALGLKRIYLEVAGRSPRRFHGEIFLVVGLTAVVFTWGLHRALSPETGPEKRLRYACIQPNVPQNAYRPEMSEQEILERHVRLTAMAAKESPELLIWPEADTGEMVAMDGPLRSLVEGIRRREHFHFLLGSEDEQGQRLYNSAFLFSPGQEVFQKYDKNWLVFFGEYTPLAEYFPALRRLVPYSTDFSAGAAPVKMELPGLGISFCPLICFEDTLAGLVRSARALHPDLLINITNDSWFKDSPGSEQHLANAVFRTVENDVPMIRCGNTGVTCAISSRGVILNRLPGNIEGTLVQELRWRTGEGTLYQRWGDWIVFAAAGVCFALEIALRRSIR